jgi:hypothetical protein
MEQAEYKVEKKLKDIMERAKWVKDTKVILYKEEMKLSVPLLYDLSLVGNIYDLFVSYHRGRNFRSIRKQFIFIVLYFFSPSALGGMKMRRGLRDKIADVLQCTASNVSHDYGNVGFFYVKYRNFRNDVNKTIERMFVDLGIEEGH